MELRKQAGPMYCSLRTSGRYLLVLLTVLIVGIEAGCASTDFGLSKPGATQKDFDDDHLACRNTVGLGGAHRFDLVQIVGSVVPRYREELTSCLIEKGWVFNKP